MNDHHAWKPCRHMLAGTLATVILVAGFGGWAVTATIAGAIVVSGQIEVEHSHQVVQHADGGMVEAVLVAEGETVSAGQVLVRLDGTLLHSELAIVEGQYFELLSRQARLIAERDEAQAVAVPESLAELMPHRPDVREIVEGQQRLFQARHRTLAQQIEQLDRQREQSLAQLDGLAAQERAIARESELLHRDLASQEILLAQGLIQAGRVGVMQREAARLAGLHGAVTAERAQVQGRLSEIALQILSLGSGRREEAEGALRELGIRTLELAERRRSLLEFIARLELRAPVAGRVHALQITTARAVLRPAEPVLQIVPHGRPLVLSVRITPSDIDQVHIGQEASVLFSAFSLRDMPDLRGIVSLISADVFQDDRLGHRYYRAEIVLSRESRALLAQHALVPGMPVEAFIRTGDRTPLDFLTRPLFQHVVRAFRES